MLIRLQFGFGQSNPTYLLTAKDGQRFVMRKKPPGKLLSRTAHQVDREFRIIHALENTDVPVPRAILLCGDDSIVGTAFYIMEFLDGRMVTEAHFPGFSAEDRHEMWHDAVRTLAKFHKVIPKEVGLETFGRPNGFYDRQLKTFSTLQKDQAATKDKDTHIPVGEIPHFAEMSKFFKDKARQPKDRGTLIHGDYKIDNLVFHKTEPRVIGILDWEMATVGHPLSDIVNLTAPWTWATGPGATPGTLSPEFAPGGTPGLPSLDQVIQWYTEESGYDVSKDLGWGNAFGGYRNSIIMQGIAARYANRQASGVTAKEYASKMKPYGDWAWGMVEKLLDGSGSSKL
jgi:aminoglycoside phosphotransferase (APT) family kinase protein